MVFHEADNSKEDGPVVYPANAFDSRPEVLGYHLDQIRQNLKKKEKRKKKEKKEKKKREKKKTSG